MANFRSGDSLAYLSLFIRVRRATAKWPRPQGPVVEPTMSGVSYTVQIYSRLWNVPLSRNVPYLVLHRFLSSQEKHFGKFDTSDHFGGIYFREFVTHLFKWPFYWTFSREKISIFFIHSRNFRLYSIQFYRVRQSRVYKSSCVYTKVCLLPRCPEKSARLHCMCLCMCACVCAWRCVCMWLSLQLDYSNSQK